MPEKIDFAQIIAGLHEAGMSTYKIALAMHQKWEKVDRWANGKSEPAHYEGEMLIEIYKEVVLHVKPPATGLSQQHAPQNHA